MANTYNLTLNNVVFYEDKNGNKISRTTVSIPLDLLKADKQYQRIDTSSDIKIKRLAENWDDTLCDPVRVVAHPEEEAFYLIDGWHRYNAAELIEGKEFLEAKVIVFHSDDYAERQKYEAGLFLRQGDNREILKPAQMHNGRCLVGDDAALIVKELCERDGVTIALGAKRGERVLGNYAKAYMYAKKRGKACLEYMFDAIKYSGFNLEPSGYSGYMMNVFSTFYTGYGNVIPAKTIGNYLRNMNIETFKARAIAKYPESSGHDGVKAMIMYLQDYATEVLSLPAVFDANGKKVISISAKKGEEVNNIDERNA